MDNLKIIKTRHYKLFHERYVPWSLVVTTIYTAKKTRKGKDIFEFKSNNIYILCKKENNILKVINAKRK